MWTFSLLTLRRIVEVGRELVFLLGVAVPGMGYLHLTHKAASPLFIQCSLVVCLHFLSAFQIAHTAAISIYPHALPTYCCYPPCKI